MDVEVTPEMEERIARIEERLGNVADDVKETQSMVRKALFGTNGTPGHAVRIDRLEQWKAGASKLIWTLVGGGVTLGVGILVWLVTG